MTENQEATLDFIGTYQEAHGIPPSTRQIQRHFRYGSHTSVVRQLHALAAVGQVEQTPNGSWCLKGRQAQLHLFAAPVYGSIPAGLPAMREQEPEETITLDPALFGVRRPRPYHLWALRVTGDSMEGARIFDGDLAVFERREPRPGDIIAALVDGSDSTLKRYVIERGKKKLRAENPRYPDITFKQLECQGVWVGSIRRNV